MNKEKVEEKEKKFKLNKFLKWILIILLHFLVICYFRYQNIYISNLFEFLFIWITTTSYTMLFIISIQFIFPFKDASNAEIS